jgi:malate synthase
VWWLWWGLQAVQCDFDDGFCPSWRNVLRAIFNLSQASRTALTYRDVGGRSVGLGPKPAVMMLRPRAWNMAEVHLHVNGRAVPGPLFDFG